MEQILQSINNVPNDIQLVLAVGFACFFGVLIAIWGVSAFFRRPKQRHRNPAANILEFPKDRKRSKPKAKRKLLSKLSFSPLLLVALAVIWAIGSKYIPTNLGQGELLVGQVTHVRDGDTLEVNGRAIRLNGLTCDERGTRLGDRATQAMKSLISGQTLTCTLNGDRTYDREVGRCKLADGRDIGAELIATGLCGRCAAYDPLRTYAAVQRKAGPFQGAYPGYCRSLW